MWRQRQAIKKTSVNEQPWLGKPGWQRAISAWLGECEADTHDVDSNSSESIAGEIFWQKGSNMCCGNGLCCHSCRLGYISPVVIEDMSSEGGRNNKIYPVMTLEPASKLVRGKET